MTSMAHPGAEPEIFEMEGALCWSGFTWYKKAKITLECKTLWRNISISVFKFSPFLHTMKAYRRNLLNFAKFTNALKKTEKKD